VSYLRGRPGLGDVVTCSAPPGSSCPSGCPGGATCDYASTNLAKYQIVGGKCYELATGKEVSPSLMTCYAKPRTSSGPSVGSQAKTGFLAVLDWFGGQRAAERAGAAVPVQSGMPSWVMPVGLAAVGIGAVLILTKKKRPAPAAGGAGA
jgi:hypothetical protein